MKQKIKVLLAKSDYQYKSSNPVINLFNLIIKKEGTSYECA
jgi:hypothetical protein